MEESDNMLVSSLREFVAVPEYVVGLKDIRAEEIFAISVGVLEYLRVDVNEVRALSGKAQRFRSMAKLNQSLHQELQAQFELNELMNPSVPFLRKFLLALINKLASGEGQEKGKSRMKKEQTGQTKQGSAELKGWLNQQWIHPSLSTKRPKYKGFILPLTINKNLLKNNVNLSSELSNPQLSTNVQSILASTLSKHGQRVREFEANEGISRKEGEEAAIRLQGVVKANKDDWAISSNKLQKLKKKIVEQDSDSTIKPPELVSVFNKELQQAETEAEKKKNVEESKPSQIVEQMSPEMLATMNPFELLRRQAENRRQQHEIQIRDVLNELKQRKEAIEQWEQDKVQVETKMTSDEQKMVKLKQQTVELKKKVEKRQAILSTLEGEKDVEEEVKKLQSEIVIIQQQVKEEVGKLESEIKEMQAESKHKMEALSDLKTKLTKIENQYQNICEEIVEKDELKGGVKIMKSGISRLYYHKKISEMEGRWRETEKQTKKLRNNLQQLREKTRVSGTLNLRMQTEIENILNMDKSKNEPENKLLRELMTKCKETFQTTLKTLEEVNEVKLQTQDYEMKVHSLSGKNYKQNIERISNAMEDLRKEIAELSRSRR